MMPDPTRAGKLLGHLPCELGFLVGAGDGNRTRMTSLEGWGSAIELRPRDPGGGASAATGSHRVSYRPSLYSSSRRLTPGCTRLRNIRAGGFSRMRAQGIRMAVQPLAGFDAKSRIQKLAVAYQERG